MANLINLLAYLPIITFFQSMFAKTSTVGAALPFSIYTPVVNGKQYQIVGTITEVK